MTLKLLPDSDKFLKKKQEITLEHPSTFKDIIDQMFETMYNHDGIGLAANQVGLSINLFVMEVKGKRRVVFNPKILHKSTKYSVYDEGCLSFPKLKLKISRPEKVTLQYTDENGDIQTEEFDGLAARCVLHECDHLQGQVFTSKVNKRELLKQKVKLLNRK